MRTAPRAAAPVLLCTLVLACLHAVLLAPAVEAARGVTVARDVRVAGAGHARVTVDVWRRQGQPRRARLRPVALLVHGGGWHTGDKRQWEQSGWAPRLAARGWVVVNANYRLACGRSIPAALRSESFALARAAERAAAEPRDQRLCGHSMRSSIADVRATLRFVDRQARRWGGDRERIVLFGASAGAQLAMLAGSEPARPRGVRAVVALSPPADLAWVGRRPELAIHLSAARSIGCGPQTCLTRWRAVSPLAQVRRRVTPPTWVFNAAADPITPIEPVRSYVQRLRTAKVPATLVTTASPSEGCHGPRPCATAALAGTNLGLFDHALAWIGPLVR